MRFLTVILILSAVLFPLAGLEPQTATRNSVPDQWTQFRGNHSLTGVASSVPAQNLKLAWTYDAKESIESSAAIPDGKVFVGASSGDLIALDLLTGKLLWKY